MILKYSDFLFEKLGVLSSLEKITDLVIDELKDKNYFLLETEYLGKKIKINFFLQEIKGLDGIFRVDDPEKLEFTIKIEKLSKNILIHELKHMDRALRRDLKTDAYHYLNHIGKYVANKYKYLFKNKTVDLFLNIVYYSNPDEFEAYYNDMHLTLKEMTNGLTEEEKRLKIKDYLSNSEIYIMYKFFYENKFDISNFFKSNKDANMFIDVLYDTIEKFGNKEEYYIKIGNVIKNRIKNLFKKEDLNIKSNDINYYINKNIRRNYPKFSRLYVTV
jgi:hypothetical protein